MKSDAAVAIVGGGYSGTILAAQLARRGIRSYLIDGSGRVGRGVAYSTTEPAHLLNVRAEGMSAWSGDTGHFAEWFEQRGGDRRGFAQRRLFAEYLAEILRDAVGSGFTEVVDATALNAHRNGRWEIELDNGRRLHAAALALAIGNQEPEALAAFEQAGPCSVANPWGNQAQAAVRDLVETGRNVLLVGTGLTMVDVVLSLEAAGFDGRIVAVSRRGQVPRAHSDFDAAPVDLKDVPQADIGKLMRWLRRRAAEVGWRAAVDSLRPHSHPIWQSLTRAQQQRFLRHVRPWWDVHRHRIAPEVAQILARLVADGFLEVVAGRIVSAAPAEEGIEVTIRRRGSAKETRELFAYAFNCTGPLQSISRTSDPLLRSLLDEGQASPDHLGIGLEVDGNSRAGDHLWALGPLTKGRYWEIIAVPDIRDQAAAVAADIERELSA